jgi:diacylglycerol kinase family enzyme
MQQEQEIAQATSLRPQGFAMLLANRKSGSFSKHPRVVDEMGSFLRQRGWRVDVHTTTSAEDAGHLTRRAVAQEDIQALHFVVGNTKLYGSVIKFTWKAKCDDGFLDVSVVRQPGKLKRLAVMLDFLLHRGRKRQWVSYHTCHSVEVHTRKPIAVQCDGEPIGSTPTTVRIVPKALKVIVPQETPESVFSKGQAKG